MLSFDDIARITGGKVLRQENSSPVTFLLTDSRKAIFNESSLFFAIKGKFHDGNRFIGDLYRKGIRQFIVESPDADRGYTGANLLLVPDSIHALQQIAAYHRYQYNLKLIGITGSNGKTIVKEWLSQLLSWKDNVIKSPKSYNSQIGVPLSVWQINENHEFGIFEAGISRKGEMKNLYEILKPDFGIFTNIGPAHDEGFESTDQKIREKLELFRSAKLVVICSDYENIVSLARENLKGTKCLTWGRKNADIPVNFESDPSGDALINCTYNSIRYRFYFQFTDKASLENVMQCIALLLYLKWDPALIQQGLNVLTRVSMRLELKRGVNDCYIIDDSYNNDLISLEIGLNFMASQANNDKKTLILSDVLQTGLPEDVLYGKIAELLNQYNIQKLIGIGNSVKTLKNFINGNSEYYDNALSFINKFDTADFHNEMILVKGARPFEFEKIIAALQEKIHGTVLEIDLDSVIHNFNIFRARLKPDTRIMVMVKALAYGNGILEIANLMQYHRADYLGVAYADEGVFLRKNGIGMPVMVMNPTPESFDKIIEFRLEPEIYSILILKQFADFIKSHNRPVNIHLKIETGMHRLGFSRDDLNELIFILKENKNLTVKSIFSHLAASDEPEQDEYTRAQCDLFAELTDILRKDLGIDPILHIANSAAIIRFPEYHFDMVRLGIGLYGLGPGKIDTYNLKPVSTLKTIISQIQHLKPGDTVGYGRRGKINTPSSIATIAIGYADGFSRSFSNGKGKVFVNGSLVPVIGNVCMDMCMIDVTGVAVKEGDEVIIFGKENSITDLAASINTIPYEILTSISERVKRIYLKD